MTNSHDVQDVLAFYDSGSEFDRLQRGIGPLECARTKQLLQRYLPPAPAVIYDVGAGPGEYSFWLAERGYEVHAIDIAPLHVEHARQRAAALTERAPASIAVGDARSLPFSDASADAVILHGPLYHLIDREQRLAALREARRVVRAGGTMAAFTITRPASTLVGLHLGWIWDDDYLQMCRTELHTGEHHRPESWPKLFTTAFFHDLNELAAELKEAGLEPEQMLGVQGPGWIVPDFAAAWATPEHRDVLLKVAEMMEREPALSPHVMTVARR